MKNYQVEKEYKMMLDEDNFHMITSTLKFDEIITQVNYYYTAGDNMGMRIRELNDHFFYTLKHFHNGEVREYEWEIPENRIDDPSIRSLLDELHLDNPEYLGSLKTIRYLKKYSKGELCLDDNEYLGYRDFELEYELNNPDIDDFITLDELLKSFNLEFKVNNISKYTRFKNTLKEKLMKKTAIFIANGLEECEALNTADLLKRAGINVDLVSVEDTLDIISSHSLHFKADMLMDEIDVNAYDALILPGGLKGTETLSKNIKLKGYLDEFYQSGRLIAAICAAPSIFVRNGYVKECMFSVYPGFESGLKASSDKVSVDRNVITAKGLGASFEFAHAIITYLVSREKADSVLKEIQY